MSSFTQISVEDVSNGLVKQVQDINIIDSNDNGEGDENENDEDDDDEDEKLDKSDGKSKKKKKKKPKKKKSSSSALAGSLLPKSRMLTGFTDYYLKYGQTNPPTRKVEELFPKGDFPLGEILPHGETKYPNTMAKRVSDEEKRYKQHFDISHIEKISPPDLFNNVY